MLEPAARERHCDAPKRRADRAPSASDGAVALVLKRLDDARRDGDRVHAVIRAWDGGWENALWRGDDNLPGFVDVHSARPLLTAQPVQRAGLLRRYSPPGGAHSHGRSGRSPATWVPPARPPVWRPWPRPRFAWKHKIIPGLAACPDWLCQSGAIPGPVLLPEGSQFWLRNRQGLRRAVVAASNLGGLGQSVLLEESGREGTPQSARSLDFGAGGRAGLRPSLNSSAPFFERTAESQIGRGTLPIGVVLRLFTRGWATSTSVWAGLCPISGPTFFARRTPRTNSSAISSTLESGGPTTPRVHLRIIVTRFSAPSRWVVW